MRKLLTILVMVFSLFVFSSVAMAEDPGGGGGDGAGALAGNILSLLGLSSGCGAAASAPCASDPTQGLFASVACKVMQSFNEGVIPLYCNIVSNPDYLAAIDAAMLLYCTLLGFSFIFGFMPMKAGAVFGKIFKALIIYSILINADLFFALIYNAVLQTPQDAVRVMLSANTGAANAGAAGAGSNNFFEYVDKGMHQIFNSIYQSQGADGSGQSYNKTNLKIIVMGLAIWQLGGDMIGGIFFAVVIGWIINYFSIMIRYLLAMLSMMFLLMLGPIFIPTMLFEQSKYLGEEWIFMIICFIMQIVLVVAFVLMVQGFFIEFYDLIKQGLESQATMSESTDKMLVPFNTENNENNGALRVTDRTGTTGYTSQAAEQYFSQTFGGDYKSQLPQMVIKLIKMMVIVMFATMFMDVVPSLAALLVGRARYIMIFKGSAFGGKRATQADLLGQDKNGIVRQAKDVRSAAEKAPTPTGGPTGPGGAGGAGKGP